jgi:hypothetical protein
MKAGLATILVLYVVGCGSSGLTEAGFGGKANSICRELNRRATNGQLTSANLQARISDIEVGIARLAKLKPPAREKATYADFLQRLRHLLRFAKDSGPRLLALTQQLERAMPSRVSRHSARHAVVRFKHVARLIASLEKPVQTDVRLAGADARALHLTACAIGASGG